MNRWGKRIHNEFIFVYFEILTCALSFLALLFANAYSIVILGMVMLTVGEATVFPTIPAVVNNLSPVQAKRKYQGLPTALISFGKVIGPLLGGNYY
ncbi:MFS transporter [uncultured Limosilactobacillus sp.]|uniref:MFS transporter n=1 Tax=uncultured Limosilactobacillus sp. TaxID=2837629 RepID=UPI00344EE4ED